MKDFIGYLFLCFRFIVLLSYRTCAEELPSRIETGIDYNTETDSESFNLEVGISITLHCTDTYYSMFTAFNPDMSNISPFFPGACAFRPFYHKPFSSIADPQLSMSFLPL
jgi:hypothetical protein